MNRRLISGLAFVLAGAWSLDAMSVTNNSDLATQFKIMSAKQKRLAREVEQLKQAKKSNKETARLEKDKGLDPKVEAVDVSALYFGGTPVITSPLVGLRSEYDGSDLITLLSSANEDVRLLKQRQVFENGLVSKGHALPENPLLELSGKVEAVATYQHPYVGANHNDINLTSAEIDTLVHFAHKALGFMSIKYDNSPGPTGRRVNHSRVFVDKAFLTFGNLNASPFYLTMGQFVVPFGRYSSFLVSSPFPMALGQTKNRAVSIGYQHSGDYGFFAQGYYYKGDVRLHGQNNGGANIGVHFGNAKAHGELATGVMYDLADSNGLQSTGGSNFGGFGSAFPANESLVHAVHGFDINGKLSVGTVTFIGEYVTATRAFSPQDLAYNGHGAKPWALHTEAAYEFKVKEKPTNIAIGYDRSGEALALDFPRSAVTVALNTSLMKDTIQSIEYRHDWNYGSNASAFGRGGISPFPTAGLGRSGDTVTLQVGGYF